MKRISSKLLLAPLLAVAALVVVGSGIASAQTGGVFLSTPVPGALVDKGKQVSFSIDVNNTTSSGKTVDLTMSSAPEGWKPVLKDRGFVVRSVWIAAGKSEMVDLQLQAPADAKQQDYEFVLKASGPEVDTSTLRLLVGIKEGSTVATRLNVQYPTLQGKAGGKFGFKADLYNDSEADRSYGLSAKGPDGWDVVFKPSYQDTQISSLQVKTGSSQSLDITVTPPARVQAGEYPITLTASSPSDRATADLKVVVTGSFEMLMTTRGDLFNTSATAGQNNPFYVTITNIGSAALQNVSLSSSKPDGWTVTFSPDKIDSLEPGASREVTMQIKPGDKAIAGDYMLNVTASQPQASVNRDIRVAVETSTLWGWVGVVILLAVIGGLMGLFVKLGRR